MMNFTQASYVACDACIALLTLIPLTLCS